MPDNALAGLYPQFTPPKPLDPFQALGAVGNVIDIQRKRLEMNANQAIGESYRDALTPSGFDPTKFVSGVKSDPRAAYGLPQATGTFLANRGQQITNAKSAFDLVAGQQQYILNGLGALADKPDLSKEDVLHWVTTGARAAGIPGSVSGPWAIHLPDDREALRKQLLTARNMAIGSLNASSRVTGPPGEGGGPTTMSLGQANFAGAGGGAGGGTAPAGPGLPTGLAPGVAEAQRGEAKSGQEAARGLQNAANEIPQQRTQLDLMRNDLATAASKFGPTAKYEKVANAVAGRVLGFHPTMSKEEIAGLESFDKVARQIALSQAGALHATDQNSTHGARREPEYRSLGLRQRQHH